MRFLIATQYNNNASKPSHAKFRAPRSDDELVAHLLIYTWALNTGRTLRSDVPPHELTEQELIDFWADDMD